MESIIETLAEYFSPKFNKKLKRCENIELLIEKLEHKELRIEQKLATELADTQRDSLMTKLAVLRVQKDKAKDLLADSQKKE